MIAQVAREDKLPKKICQDCVCKVELFYAFCNTTANSEKQLLQLLGDVQIEDDKQNYIGNVLSSVISILCNVYLLCDLIDHVITMSTCGRDAHTHSFHENYKSKFTASM